jgi:uncharacterized surface protein with fasciclin (FAS1) repeats
MFMATISKSPTKIRLAGIVALLGLLFYSCNPTIDERYITTFTGDLVYSYLKKDTANFSEFVKYIDRAGLKGMLSAYGKYTCLAPTNAAFRDYYAEKGPTFTIDSLSLDEIKYIAKTHIIGQKYLTQDLSDGVIPTNNMNDRVVEILYTTDTTNNSLKIVLNKQSEILERDIEVYNGVIEKINKVLQPATAQLPDLMATDPNLKIFSSALKLTGLADSLTPIIDNTYVPYVGYKDEYNGYAIPSPPLRKYAFTALVESDQLYQSKGINNLNDLIDSAKVWYPSDAAYDTLYGNRNNSLNKFMSYHLIEKAIYSNRFYYSSHAALNVPLYEFIETMYSNRLIKVSDQKQKVGMVALVNPNSDNELYVTNKNKTTVNGVYHYLTNILLYTSGVEQMISQSRIRFDYSALLPEMMNNNLRLASTQGNGTGDRYGIPPGYFKYMKVATDTRIIYLAGSNTWINYQGDEMMGLGNYDITVRLMPVPPGTYELRFGYSANGNRSITQIYVDGKPVGIPLNLTILASDARIGWVLDSQTDDNGVDNDKTMRNRGYMKGPSTFVKYDGTTPIAARSVNGSLRRIIGTFTFDTYEPHYIRFKSVLDKPSAQCMMDYFEYVPKIIYNPPGGIPEERD